MSGRIFDLRDFGPSVSTRGPLTVSTAPESLENDSGIRSKLGAEPGRIPGGSAVLVPVVAFVVEPNAKWTTDVIASNPQMTQLAVLAMRRCSSLRNQ